MSRERRPGWSLEGGPRGKVGGYSAGSRRRLGLFLYKLHNHFVSPGSPWPVFWTITLPGDWEDLNYKAAFKSLEMRFRRAFPESFSVWSLEYQKRGAPHYHGFLCFSQSDYEALHSLYAETRSFHWLGREKIVEELIAINKRFGTPHPFDLWLQQNWPTVLRVVAARTDAQYVLDPRSQYLQKEASKTRQREKTPHLGGRYWGCWNLGAARAVQVCNQRALDPDEYLSLRIEIQAYWDDIQKRANIHLERIPGYMPSDVPLRPLLCLLYPEAAQKLKVLPHVAAAIEESTSI